MGDEKKILVPWEVREERYPVAEPRHAGWVIYRPGDPMIVLDGATLIEAAVRCKELNDADGFETKDVRIGTYGGVEQLLKEGIASVWTRSAIRDGFYRMEIRTLDGLTVVLEAAMADDLDGVPKPVFQASVLAVSLLGPVE